VGPFLEGVGPFQSPELQKTNGSPRIRKYQVMAEKRNEGLLVRAHPLEQAERISRSMVGVQLVDGALLLDADLAWAGAINTVLVKRGVRVSDLCRLQVAIRRTA
jgi:hypothetical protein